MTNLSERMNHTLNTTIVLPVAIVSCLNVFWILGFSIFLQSNASESPASNIVTIKQLENSSPDPMPDEIVASKKTIVNTNTDNIDLTMDTANIDRSLLLTPSPQPTNSPTPAPTNFVEVESTTAKPTTPPVAASTFDPIFSQWSSHFGVDLNLLKYIAKCESRFNPDSVGGIYGGMYQFSASTWKSTRTAMNHDPDPNLRFDPAEAIKTAAFKIANGGKMAWKNCLPK